jgi:hypothetical protein
LEVDPYSDVNPSSETKITYSFRVTNEGEGKATNLHFVLPYGEFLTIADFTDKSSDKEWVSKVDAVNSNVTVELPDLDKDATVSGKLVFNPKKGKSIPDGTKVETSYVLIYQDPANAAITINSNLATLVFKAVYGKLEVDNENNKFRFTSNNLLKGEKVSAWITKPDGTSVDLQTLGYHGVAFSGYNGQNGELYIRITFQDSEGLDDVVTATDFPNGNYTVVAYGNDSKITLSANIDVYR